MLIGARTGAWAKSGGGGWVNPYVTDGLIGMWDAEWNAGGGVHDASATEIVDLAGTIGNLSQCLRGGTIDIFTNKIRFNYGSCYKSVDRAWFGTGPYTFEFVGKIISSNDSYALGLMLENPWMGINMDKLSYTRFSPNSGQDIDCQTNMSVIHGASLTRNGNSGDYYIDGSSRGSYSRGAYDYSVSQSLRVGIWPDQNVHNRIGEFYCARVYNTALTASQIYSNYEVDKERFNLP